MKILNDNYSELITIQLTNYLNLNQNYVNNWLTVQLTSFGS